jgi:tRNA-dihydrouridine synthase 2
MRDRDKAMIERLKEIVDFVKGMGKDIAVIENGDCLGTQDAERVRQVTGAHSVMIARAAESNPSCFSKTPLTDVHETLVPSYLRLSRYLDNHWSLTKFCVSQFKSPHTKVNGKAEDKRIRDFVVKAKSFDDVAEIAGGWTGDGDFREIARAIELREVKVDEPELSSEDLNVEAINVVSEGSLLSKVVEQSSGNKYETPIGTQNPHPPGPDAPFVADFPRTLPTLISGQDPITPTHTPPLSVR